MKNISACTAITITAMTSKTMPAITLLEKHIRSAEHSWSIGVSGAIAEFMYEQDEQIVINMEGA